LCYISGLITDLLISFFAICSDLTDSPFTIDFHCSKISGSDFLMVLISVCRVFAAVTSADVSPVVTIVVVGFVMISSVFFSERPLSKAFCLASSTFSATSSTFFSSSFYSSKADVSTSSFF